MWTICNTIRISLLFTLVVYLCGAKKGTALKSCCEGTDYRVHIHFMCAVTLTKFLYTLFYDSVLVWPLKEDGHYVVGCNFKPCMLCPLGTEVAGLVTPRTQAVFTHTAPSGTLREIWRGSWENTAPFLQSPVSQHLASSGQRAQYQKPGVFARKLTATLVRDSWLSHILGIWFSDMYRVVQEGSC